jgi:hypothetical protein
MFICTFHQINSNMSYSGSTGWGCGPDNLPFSRVQTNHRIKIQINQGRVQYPGMKTQTNLEL